ncbi:MAG: DUF3160 domain-containing protein [Anaerolineales bacterium]|nr:DUF3160 domain-containing protein [Anaerolineales bacterium]
MFTSKRRLLFVLLLVCCWILGLISCKAQPKSDPSAISVPAPVEIDLEDFLAQSMEGKNYLPEISFAPTDAQYFDLVDQTFALNSAEISLLEKNGFVVSDRLAFDQFMRAYAYMYWKDLPILITTDSMLHAVHQTYDQLLMETEVKILTPKLITLLRQTRAQIRIASQVNSDPALAALYNDLDIYLSVPLNMLTNEPLENSTAIEIARIARAGAETGNISLFGGQRQIDFTLFKPRGHYTRSGELAHYFQAMSWLAHIDFRFVAYDGYGNAQFQKEHLAAALILREAMQTSGQRATWEEIEQILAFLIGNSDNTTLPDLDRFIVVANISSGSEVLGLSDPSNLLKLLTSGDYGQQHITNQLLLVAPDNPEPISRPVSFQLFGQRFVLDSYLMGNLVFDQLLVNGEKVYRANPNPLDVMYALGNDRAATHLTPELEQYGYQGNLEAQHEMVNNLPEIMWESSVYNRWLGFLRALNDNTTQTNYPQAMQTTAWADKMLHTQLASWAQLRHDNILYAKQSVTEMVTCEYPAGYVEPYPGFYAALKAYAQAGWDLFDKLPKASLSPEANEISWQAIAYFSHLGAVAERLQTMAEKELRLEPFDEAEELFLRSVVIRKLTLDEEALGCTPTYIEEWNGWYSDLFPWEDDNPALIADIHTNPNQDPPLGPPDVYHVATGPVATALFIVNTDEGQTLYVGPTFTYFEAVEIGFPPVRLTDEDWNLRLENTPYPLAPTWVTSFRLTITEPPLYFQLPFYPEENP